MENLYSVTPFVGVWIEISVFECSRSTKLVTPFVGVWIEIILNVAKAQKKNGPSLRGSVD